MKSLQEAEKKIALKEGELEQISQALDDQTEGLRALENQNHQLETEKVLAKIRKNADVLRIAALQKKYKKLEDISNKTAKLMYQ